jgi:hypothetical protein
MRIWFVYGVKETAQGSNASVHSDLPVEFFELFRMSVDL